MSIRQRLASYTKTIDKTLVITTGTNFVEDLDFFFVAYASTVSLSRYFLPLGLYISINTD